MDLLYISSVSRNFSRGQGAHFCPRASRERDQVSIRTDREATAGLLLRGVFLPGKARFDCLCVLDPFAG